MDDLCMSVHLPFLLSVTMDFIKNHNICLYNIDLSDIDIILYVGLSV